MNCALDPALLDGYVDGVLTPEEQQTVEQHLTTCPHCAQYVDDCLAMIANFPSADEVVMPDGFAQSVMAQVAQHPRKAKKTRQWQRFALPAVACLALVLFVGGDFTPQNNIPTAYSQSPDLAVTTMDSRAVADIPQTIPSSEAPIDSAYFFPTAQVGNTLDTFDATTLDDGSLSYTLTPQEFLAFVAQIEPDTTYWPEQATYWVVVIDP